MPKGGNARRKAHNTKKTPKFFDNEDSDGSDDEIPILPKKKRSIKSKNEEIHDATAEDPSQETPMQVEYAGGEKRARVTTEENATTDGEEEEPSSKKQCTTETKNEENKLVKVDTQLASTISKEETVSKFRIPDDAKVALNKCLTSVGKGTWVRNFFANVNFDQIILVVDPYEDSSGKLQTGYKVAWKKKDGNPSKFPIRIRCLPHHVAYTALHGTGNLEKRPETPLHKVKFYVVLDDVVNEDVRKYAENYEALVDVSFEFHKNLCDHILIQAWKDKKICPAAERRKNLEMARTIADNIFKLTPEESAKTDTERKTLQKHNEKVRESEEYENQVEKLALDMFLKGAKTYYKPSTEEYPNRSISVSRLCCRKLNQDERELYNSKRKKERPVPTKNSHFKKRLFWGDYPRMYAPMNISHVNERGKVEKLPEPKNIYSPVVYRGDFISVVIQPSFYSGEQGYGVCANFPWSDDEVVHISQGDRTSVGSTEDEGAQYAFATDFHVDYEVKDENADPFAEILQLEDDD